MLDANIRPQDRATLSPPQLALRGVAGRRAVVFVQPTSEIGGSDIALYRLATGLDRRMFEPIVVLPREGPLTSKLRRAGVRGPIRPMAQLRSTRNPLVHVRYAAAFVPSVLGLAMFIRRERAQIVHSNSLYTLHGAWAAWIARAPHIWHIREIPDAPPPVRALLLFMACRMSKRVVAMTHAVATMFDGGHAGSEGQLLTIPDGIDLTRFAPAYRGERIRRDLGIPPEAPVAGFVARLDPWKGAEVFVRAAAETARRFPQAHFIVCGGELPGFEAYAARLRQEASELGLDGRIHFTSWTYTVDDIPEVMGAIDVLVHTSVRPEPFGLVLIEAMATGKPVVAARDGGVPEIVVDGATGLLVEPGDGQSTGEAIVTLFNRPDRAKAMGAAGRRRAEQLFDIGVYVRRIEDVYREVLGNEEAVAA